MCQARETWKHSLKEFNNSGTSAGKAEERPFYLKGSLRCNPDYPVAAPLHLRAEIQTSLVTHFCTIPPPMHISPSLISSTHCAEQTGVRDGHDRNRKDRHGAKPTELVGARGRRWGAERRANDGEFLGANVISGHSGAPSANQGRLGVCRSGASVSIGMIHSFGGCGSWLTL